MSATNSCIIDGSQLELANVSETQPEIADLIEQIRVSLDDLIKEVHALYPTPEPLEQLAASVQIAATIGQVGDHLVSFFIDEARSAGESWGAIGERLGISRQAVQKRYAPPANATAGKHPAIFEKMVKEGKRAVVHAQHQARRRQSGYIGTEHLLLAIVEEPDCAGARSLAACGAPPQVVAAAVNGRIGVPGGEPLPDLLPFTPKGKSVLEHALRESVRLGHDFVGTGHLALACVTVKDGMAAEILANLGVRYDDLRRSVVDLAPSEEPRNGSPPDGS